MCVRETDYANWRLRRGGACAEAVYEVVEVVEEKLYRSAEEEDGKGGWFEWVGCLGLRTATGEDVKDHYRKRVLVERSYV